MKEFYKLVEVMRELRAPGGCPWDREQTIESLKPYLLEEVYETLEAMDQGGEELKGELGDLLLNIVFQSLIKEEEGEFTIDDVAKKTREKLIRRHPHIFGDITATTTEEAMVSWNNIKKKEKEHQDRVSVLDGIPKGIPPILKSYKLQKKASSLGFDWKDPQGALEKLREEVQELEEAYKEGEKEKIKDELGDLIFTAINLGRKLDIEVVDCVMKTNEKFEKRFRYVEERCNIEETCEKELDRLWEEGKRKLGKK